MEDVITRTWENLVSRVDGPMALRFILQPIMAAGFGIRDGLRFAREGRSFLLWGGPKEPVERRAQLLATCRSIGKVIIVAVVLDTVCQLAVLHWMSPLETFLVVMVVAVVPYLAVRGMVNWLAKPKHSLHPSENAK